MAEDSLSQYQQMKKHLNLLKDNKISWAKKLIGLISGEVRSEETWSMEKAPFLQKAYDFYCSDETSGASCDIYPWDAYIIAISMPIQWSGGKEALDTHLNDSVNHLFTSDDTSKEREGAKAAFMALKKEIDKHNQAFARPAPEQAPETASANMQPELSAIYAQLQKNLTDYYQLISCFSGQIDQSAKSIEQSMKSAVFANVSIQIDELKQLADKLKPLTELSGQIAALEKRLSEYDKPMETSAPTPEAVSPNAQQNDGTTLEAVSVQAQQNAGTTPEAASPNEKETLPLTGEKWSERQDSLWKELQTNQPTLRQALKGMMDFQDKITKEYVLRFAEIMIDLYNTSDDHYSYYKANENAEPLYKKIADNYKAYCEKIEDGLAEFDVKTIKPRVSELFNSTKHEAVSTKSPSSTHYLRIRELVRAGFLYRGKAIQKAKVRV